MEDVDFLKSRLYNECSTSIYPTEKFDIQKRYIDASYLIYKQRSFLTYGNNKASIKSKYGNTPNTMRRIWENSIERKWKGSRAFGPEIMSNATQDIFEEEEDTQSVIEVEASKINITPTIDRNVISRINDESISNIQKGNTNMLSYRDKEYSVKDKFQTKNDLIYKENNDILNNTNNSEGSFFTSQNIANSNIKGKETSEINIFPLKNSPSSIKNRENESLNDIVSITNNLNLNDGSTSPNTTDGKKAKYEEAKISDLPISATEERDKEYLPDIFKNNMPHSSIAMGSKVITSTSTITSNKKLTKVETHSDPGTKVANTEAEIVQKKELSRYSILNSDHLTDSSKVRSCRPKTYVESDYKSSTTSQSFSAARPSCNLRLNSSDPLPDISSSQCRVKEDHVIRVAVPALPRLDGRSIEQLDNTPLYIEENNDHFAKKLNGQIHEKDNLKMQSTEKISSNCSTVLANERGNFVNSGSNVQHSPNLKSSFDSSDVKLLKYTKRNFNSSRTEITEF